MESVSFQTGSGQDYSVCGTVGESQYMAVFDGHGTDMCIHYIRTLNMDDIMRTENPALTLWKKVESAGDFYGSGATVSMSRMTGNRIEIWSMGDSETRVFLNGDLAYSTDLHTFSNPDEIKRTEPLVDFILPTKAPFPVSYTRVENIESSIGHFKTGESLVPSQSLGHNGMTGFDPCFKQIVFDPKDKVRIVCGSDGLFDMLVDVSKGGALELAQEAERRWRMTWDFFDGKKTYKTTYGGNIDDISCAVWEN